MITISADNVPEAYSEVLGNMRVNAKQQDSRNGPVVSMPVPTMLQISYPDERVLFDPHRNANPFFHVMEFVWMMAGRDEVAWLSKFNSRMTEFADNGFLKGAYGYRWRVLHGDQIREVIRQLTNAPGTRQAVLAMWDATLDAPWRNTKDRPCNTHIYFRVIDGFLNMTVCNRSNDVIWGMLGANAVHMTMLHELVANATGLALGKYYVMSNNLHYYVNMYPQGMRLLENITGSYNYYMDGVQSVLRTPQVEPYPLLNTEQRGECYDEFIQDCKNLVDMGDEFEARTHWMRNVGQPMHRVYMARKTGGTGIDLLDDIGASDWRLACTQWIRRMEQKNEESA